MPLNPQHLKVDQTAFEYNYNYILVSNINIPTRYLSELANNGILPRIESFIIQDYGQGLDIYYQVTATYTLKHARNQTIKHWSGSFSPLGNVLNTIQEFQRYTNDTIDILPIVCNQNSVEGILRTSNVDTEWKFDTLISVVINIQSAVPQEHNTLTRRNLIPDDGNRKRVHVTFPLP